MNYEVAEQLLYERLKDFDKARRKLYMKGRASEATFISGRMCELRYIRKELKRLNEAEAKKELTK